MKYILIIATVVLSAFLLVLYNQNSEYLEHPKKGDYALVISISKEAKKQDIEGFSQKIRDFKGVYYNGNSSMKSEDKRYLFLRVNRSISVLSVSEAESILEKNINDFNLGEFVEFAVLSDSGSAGSTRSFDPSVFP